jgi:hypothetical protein
VNPGTPQDPVLRALAVYWDDVRNLADESQRQRLQALVDGTAEPDPLDALAALADLLLDLLPPDHPMVEVLRTGTMFDPGDRENAPDIRQSLARLGHLPNPPAEPLTDLDREIRGRLLDLPALSPDELRDRDIDPDNPTLIRLTHPVRGTQLPTFQFTTNGTPWPIVMAVNELLDAAADPWGVLCWWVDPHAGLDGAPADLLGGEADTLLLRAAAAVAVA